jgi:hypothetical protein
MTRAEDEDVYSTSRSSFWWKIFYKIYLWKLIF